MSHWGAIGNVALKTAQVALVIAAMTFLEHTGGC